TPAPDSGRCDTVESSPFSIVTGPERVKSPDPPAFPRKTAPGGPEDPWDMGFLRLRVYLVGGTPSPSRSGVLLGTRAGSARKENAAGALRAAQRECPWPAQALARASAPPQDTSPATATGDLLGVA